MDLHWRWDFAWQILPRLIEATLYTLAAAGIGYAIALVLGLVLALLQRTGFRPLTVATREFIEFIRSTPLLVQIFFVFFVAPQIGLQFSPWVSGMFALGLYYSAYLSEVYRGGLEAVPPGQWEACTALGLSRRDTYIRIIIPQALPPALAGMGNLLVAIFKDTPMLAVIGIPELMHTANAIGAEDYRFLEPYTIVGVLFLIISLPAAGLLRLFEGWVRYKLGIR
ncbi:ectoine/hydroxyectoine ABC transporter permease subunit EhuD [Bradyrhizobium sp. 30]|uniref:ectoine/hydroxyectoine ABC transporter permease subunit EhuD n=1 Tax=Bradyrhizobium sp. 30 TaxID=2782669 RepID=UPI001FF76E31|nr:ectoine/hydroxyectoine ABC transporter permease subunit EhuD [Bradyrhizobium sp. 30]MCK1292036.1 ectoine/hydroxyectoine ABC transporter permease subunit EhuD [Bradyrhizobium sp. 30]